MGAPAPPRRGSLAFVAALLAPAAAASAQEPDLSLDRPRYLFAARERPGWVPVLLRATSRRPDTRTVRLLVEDPEDEGAVSGIHDIALTPGVPRAAVGYLWGRSSRQWRGWMQAPGQVQVRGPEGAESERGNPPLGSAGGLQVAFLSGTTDPLPDMIEAAWPEGAPRPESMQNPRFWNRGTGVASSPVPVYPRRVAPGEMPDHPAGWDAADLLVLSSRAPLDALSADERGAVLQWVALGGAVLVSGAAPAASLSGPLCGDLLGPFAPEGVPGAAPRGGQAVAAAVGEATVPLLAGAPPGFEVLEEWDGRPVLSTRTRGHGHVFYCSADLTRPPFAGAALGRILGDAVRRVRDAQRNRVAPLGHRWPWLPTHASRFVEAVPVRVTDPRTKKTSVTYQLQWTRFNQTPPESEVAAALHTGRGRLPSLPAVLAFLAAYFAALGPGVWWVSRRLGGGLARVPVFLGAAVLFTLGAGGLGLATRGVGLVTQRVTFLWPVPGLGDAAEQTVISLYAGIGRSLTVRAAGALAPLPMSGDGVVGGGAALRVSLGAEAVAHELRVGAWETRFVCFEGIRPIGGPVSLSVARTPDGTATGYEVRNGSRLPLGAGAIWAPGGWVLGVPPLAPGSRADVEHPRALRAGRGRAPSGPSLELPDLRRRLGIPVPSESWRLGLLALVEAARTLSPTLYVAPADARDLPGGGPEVSNGGTESRILDRVFVVAPGISR
ncbi:MAG: hypothetical protein L0216_20905 [Planctomycetales bacterium]|nr:hypothetical protein [Planctomycetales bacterium]